jgi:uncharacterized protein YcbK (DUF882 family)
MTKNRQLSQNFNSTEFDSPDIPFSGNFISLDLIKILESIRADIKEPIIINSGVRSISHNKKVFGVLNSSHLTGLAVDIKIINNKYRYKILSSLFKHDVKRIGLGKDFIHLDLDTTKPQKTSWLY